MRPIDDIRAELETASGQGDIETLTRIAGELRISNELFAEALEHQALGAIERLSNRFTIAIEHYERALDLHQDLKDHRGQARDRMALGTCYSIIGDFPTALEHLHAALALLETLNDRPGVAGILHQIGGAHRNTGDYPTALEFEHRSLTVYEDLGDLSGVARVTSSIGSAHGDSGNRADALSHYQRALKIYESLGDQRGVAQVIGNMGTLHIDSDDYDEGLREYGRALEIAESLEDQGAIAGWMINIAFVLLDTGRLVEARALIDRFSSLRINDPRIRIIRHNLMGHLLEHEGKLDDAKDSYEHALEEANKFSLRSEASDLHKSLRDLAEKRNDFPGYIQHNNAYTQLADEIKGKEAALKMVMQQKQREIETIEQERERERAVLYSTLPQHVADRMVRGERVTDQFEAASVIFLDIVGFTKLSDHLLAEQVVDLLEGIFKVCDTVCNAHGITKVKTIGDSYLAVSGVPEPSADHAHRMALAAVDMMKALNELELFMDPGKGDVTYLKDSGDITVRMGVHCGPLVAGVVGTERLQYDIWGDTVNTASRMESTGTPNKIQVSPAFADALRKWAAEHPTNVYQLVERGEVEVKGKGTMTTFWLERQ